MVKQPLGYNIQMRSLIKNKRAFLPALSFGMVVIILIFLILVIIGLFVFTSINKYAIIGGGAIALTLIYGLRGEMNKTKAWFMGVIIVGGLIFIFASGTSQSVLGFTSIDIENGKAVWNLYAKAETGDQFLYTYLPSKYTLTDGSGTEVTPKRGITLVVKAGEPTCKYQTQYVNNVYPQRDYWILKNPERILEVDFTDREGVTKTIDGTRSGDQTSFSGSNGGTLIVQSQGTLGGKYNCPSYENVAIWNEDNQAYYLNGGDFANPLSGKKLNTQFINGFRSGTLDVTDNYVIGEIPQSFSGTYTVVADQDYFNSVVYTPPKQSDPDVQSINTPSSIKTGETASISSIIKNNGYSGNVLVKASSSAFSIQPSSDTIYLDKDKSKTMYFTIKAPSSEQCGDIKIEACSVSQVEANKCDSMTKNLCAKSGGEDSCGNGVCESFETYETCPQDCLQEKCNSDSDCEEGKICKDGKCVTDIGDCEWYQEPYTTNKLDYSWYNYIGIGEPKPYTESGCKTSTGVYVLALILAGTILGTLFILKKKNKRKRRK